MSPAKYATVLWENENTYSAVKISKICLENNAIALNCELIDKYWTVEFEKGKFEVGKVIATGSRAKMEQLAADEAEEVANKSIQEKENDVEYLANSKSIRKDLAQRKNPDIDIQSACWSVKKLKRNQKANNLERQTMSVIDQLKQVKHVDTAPAPDMMTEEAELGPVMLESTFMETMNELNAGFTEVNTSRSKPVDISDVFKCATKAQEPNIIHDDDIIGIGMTGDNDMITSDDTGFKDKSENELFLEEKVKTLKSKLRKAKKEKRVLQKQLDEIQSKNSTELQTVDIGNGIMVSEVILNEIKSDFQYSPSKFLRAMMYNTNLFTYQEAASSSLTGQKSREGHRPRLDFIKFSTVKDYTVKKCKLKKGTESYRKFERSVRDVCTDARKHLRGRANTVSNV